MWVYSMFFVRALDSFRALVLRVLILRVLGALNLLRPNT